MAILNVVVAVAERERRAGSLLQGDTSEDGCCGDCGGLNGDDGIRDDGDSSSGCVDGSGGRKSL
jgi:hypothetical protein